MSPLAGQTGALIFTLIELAAFSCTVIATPVGWFFPKDRVTCTGEGGACYKKIWCYTLWGFKGNCDSTHYNSRTATWGCDHRKNNMISGCVFAIASIIFTLVLLILGALMVLGSFKMCVLNVILSVIAVGTTLVCWAVVADVHNSKFCKDSSIGYKGYAFKEGYNLAGGFVLMVIACGLQIINTILAFLI